MCVRHHPRLMKWCLNKHLTVGQTSLDMKAASWLSRETLPVPYCIHIMLPAHEPIFPNQTSHAHCRTCSLTYWQQAERVLCIHNSRHIQQIAKIKTVIKKNTPWAKMITLFWFWHKIELENVSLITNTLLNIWQEQWRKLGRQKGFNPGLNCT